MKREFDFLAFLGRFNPWHLGHHSVLQTALQKADHVVIIVGSTNRPRTAKNPLTFDERKAIIESTLTVDEKQRVVVVPCNDYMYNDSLWESEIQTIMRSVTHLPWRDKLPKIGIIGHSKDHSSYYLKKFPQWPLVEVPATYPINATDVRISYYENNYPYRDWFVNDAHFDLTTKYFESNDMDIIRKEYDHIKKYKKSFEQMPYPPVFVTTDAVVIQSGHILLVKRGAMPGEGLWALPGGFLNQHEHVQDGMIRELIEETQIGVRRPKLEGSIVNWFVADNPDRSQRGRTISHVALIKLPDNELPSIKGSDDAADAKWFPLSEYKLMQNQMFEDHFDITTAFNII